MILLKLKIAVGAPDASIKGKNQRTFLKIPGKRSPAAAAGGEFESGSGVARAKRVLDYIERTDFPGTLLQ